MADTLRHYEKDGLLPPIHRSESGIRNYGEQDVRLRHACGARLPIEVPTTISHTGEDATIAARLMIPAGAKAHNRIAKMAEMQETLTC